MWKTLAKVGWTSAMLRCSDGHLSIPSVSAKVGALFFQWRLSNPSYAWCHWLSFQSQHAGFAILNRTTAWCMIGHSKSKSAEFGHVGWVFKLKPRVSHPKKRRASFPDSEPMFSVFSRWRQLRDGIRSGKRLRIPNQKLTSATCQSQWSISSICHQTLQHPSVKRGIRKNGKRSWRWTASLQSCTNRHRPRLRNSNVSCLFCLGHYMLCKKGVRLKGWCGRCMRFCITQRCPLRSWKNVQVLVLCFKKTIQLTHDWYQRSWCQAGIASMNSQHHLWLEPVGLLLHWYLVEIQKQRFCWRKDWLLKGWQNLYLKTLKMYLKMYLFLLGPVLSHAAHHNSLPSCRQRPWPWETVRGTRTGEPDISKKLGEHGADMVQ